MRKDSWHKSDTKSISEKVLGKVRPGESLSKKISTAQREFDGHIMTLSGIQNRLQKIHDSIFQKIMHAQRSNHPSHARAYAQELSHVRNMLNMVKGAKLSLEQVKIRLDTVTEFGDVVVTLSPCMSLIRGLAPSLSGIMPQANTSLNDLSQMLGDVMTESSMTGIDNGLEIGGSSEEALSILDEAHSAMMGAAKSAFPDIPTEIAGNSSGIASHIEHATNARAREAAQPSVESVYSATSAQAGERVGEGGYQQQQPEQQQQPPSIQASQPRQKTASNAEIKEAPVM